MNALSEKKNAVAMEVARVIYGGIDEKSPQWQSCQLVASAVEVLGEEFYLKVISQRPSASVAFEKQRAFNKTCPVSTKGILRRSDGATAVTEVSKEAWVFPDPLHGESVMAWFHNIGWAPVDQFSPQDEQATPAQELTLLGQQARNQGRLELAEYLYKAATLADPKYWRAMNEVGVLLQHQQRYDESLEFFNRAIEINPQSGELHNNRGMLLRSVGRADDAVKDCDEALRWLPGNEQIMLNAAGALDEVGRVDECMKIVRAYNERHPDNANARYNLALLLLLGDEFAEGWQAYDSRLLQPTANSHYEHFGVPRWRGEPLAGKSVLIWPEQGLGDEIMTASMVGDVIAAGAKVTYLCSERLDRSVHALVPDRAYRPARKLHVAALLPARAAACRNEAHQDSLRDVRLSDVAGGPGRAL
jgi:tetratricopeptide (TPR) repeat protein